MEIIPIHYFLHISWVLPSSTCGTKIVIPQRIKDKQNESIRTDISVPAFTTTNNNHPFALTLYFAFKCHGVIINLQFYHDLMVHLGVEFQVRGIPCPGIFSKQMYRVVVSWTICDVYKGFVILLSLYNAQSCQITGVELQIKSSI